VFRHTSARPPRKVSGAARVSARGRTALLRASAGGLTGAHRYAVRLGSRGRTLASGRFTVTGDAASRVGLRPGQILVCRLQTARR
jgi:hypothetical protein